MSGTEYTQGGCILKNGASMAIDEILADLRRFEICRQALIDICHTLEYLERRAKENGGQLDGFEEHWADDPEVLRSIASAALAEVDL